MPTNKSPILPPPGAWLPLPEPETTPDTRAESEKARHWKAQSQPEQNMSQTTPTAAPADNDPVEPGKEPHPRNWVGKCCSFDLRRKGGVTTRESGQITAQRWLGFTVRGRIPEYEVTIVGASGRSVFARITRDHVSILD